MQVKSSIMMSMMVFYCAFFSCGSAMSYADYLRRLNGEILEYKHVKCFHPHPYHTLPNSNRKPSDKFVVNRWFYHAPSKACRPFYSSADYVFNIDDLNYNLPSTRLECESLCGDYCIAEYETGDMEVGICTSLDTTLPDRCEGVLPEVHPKQCPQKYSTCCPRDFQKAAITITQLKSI